MARFSDTSDPKLTVMLSGTTVQEFIEKMKRSITQGTEAFCILWAGLVPEEKTKDGIKRILDTAGDLPCYMTNYVRGNSQSDLPDEILAEQLLDIARMGADLIDIRADMFCRSEDEVTRDFSAVQKQKQLISEVHSFGAEVLMSTHIFAYRSPQSVLEIATMQRDRGADIAKIVTMANSEKEQEDAFRTNLLLREELNTDFLFLCNGTHCKKHRLFGPFLGSCLYMCVDNEKTQENQPTIEKAKRMKEIIQGLEQKNA